MDLGELLQAGYERFLERPARRPSVVTEPRTRGAGCVAMVWENGVLLRVEFGKDAAEAKGRAMAAVASWERETVEG